LKFEVPCAAEKVVKAAAVPSRSDVVENASDSTVGQNNETENRTLYKI